ncbi:GMC oxidoreductase [Hypomontagnella monticulosa]|nr:GMC oxidoreductase [Hypomontagnella monticulosa]
MGIYSSLPDEIASVDVIIVGGGTSGCVIASRLADADSQLTILLIEAGPDNLNLPSIYHPALYRTNYTPDTTAATYFQARREAQLAEREILIPTGGILGGGSSVNGSIYTRPQMCDFDSWNTIGWTGKEVVPFFKKFETYCGQDSQGCHGHDGPIKVSSGLHRGQVIESDFKSAMAQLGYPEVEDLQDLQTGNGVSHSRRYVSPEDGKRQDVAHAYLHPRLQDGRHSNLHVLVATQVTRVLLDQNQEATGVEYRANPKLRSGVTGTLAGTIKASKMVVLSAGTLSTPCILERSGVGDPQVLERAGIPTILALPGVGRDFQDHQALITVYSSKLDAVDTFESIYNGDRNLQDLVATRDKILSWNGTDASAKIRPTMSEINTLGEQFRLSWDEDFRNNPSRPLTTVLLTNGILGDPRPFPVGSYFTILTYTAYPYSRGHVHVMGPELESPIDFVTGYLSDDRGVDLNVQVWAYKKQREIARRMKHFHSEIMSQHPVFPPGSKASCAGMGGDISAKTGIVYSSEDDQAIERFVRESVGTTWHPIGTCKMAPVSQMGVVDETLGVHNARKLKVADMSIAPKNVSGNTMSTALMIGERAADIFIKELGLRPV